MIIQIVFQWALNAISSFNTIFWIQFDVFRASFIWFRRDVFFLFYFRGKIIFFHLSEFCSTSCWFFAFIHDKIHSVLIITWQNVRMKIWIAFVRHWGLTEVALECLDRKQSILFQLPACTAWMVTFQLNQISFLLSGELDFPPVTLHPADGFTSVEFQNPFRYYKKLKNNCCKNPPVLRYDVSDKGNVSKLLLCISWFQTCFVCMHLYG